jgi:hypothetical protein
MSRTRGQRVIAALVVLTALSGGALALTPPAVYYLQRAQYHSGMERVHTARADELGRKLAQDPGNDFLEFVEHQESQIATDHAYLSGLYRRAALDDHQTLPPELPLPFPWDRQRDREVLEAVLLEELGDPSPESARAGNRRIERIVVHDSASSSPFAEDWTIDEVAAEHGFPGGLEADVTRRNRKAGESLAELNLHHDRIIVADLTRIHSYTDAVEKYPSAEIFVRVGLPGYSRDGRHAVVALSRYVLLGPHPFEAIFGLSKTDSQWRVVWTERLVRE